MLRLLSIITVCILRVKSSEVCDDEYLLTTESIGNIGDAKAKCQTGYSWILEIYNEKVVTLLKKLNVSNQQYGILLGMIRSRNDWIWSDGTKFSGNVDQQKDNSDELATITNDKGSIRYISKRMSDQAGAICSKKNDDCTGWLHNGFCYFKPNSFYNTWFKAHNECIRHGATLAMFDNSERNFNMSFIDDQLYWVSLSRNNWMWMRSGASNMVVSFNKWAVGNPYTLPYPNYNPTCATTTSNGNEWKSVDCSGTYNIVCMREIDQYNPGCTPQATISTNTIITNGNPNIHHESTTQPYSPKSGGSSNFSEATNDEPLSGGAKAGIGVGVSLLVVLIVLIGVLVFKYFHQLKMKSGRENSRKPLESENHYAEIVSGNNKSVSTNDIPGSINYADLDLQS